MICICSEHASQKAMCWNLGPECSYVDMVGSLKSKAQWTATVAEEP